MKPLTTKAIKEILLEVTSLDDERLVLYQQDERKSVQQLVKSTIKRIDKQIQLENHFQEMKLYENNARQQGFSFIAGIDEVGRGPLAGPVVSAAVILPENFHLVEVNDSKQLSLKKREELFDQIMEQALAVGIGIKDEQVIDSVNIYEATKLAMKEAVSELAVKPDCLLIDAMALDLNIPQEKIIKGDAKSISIACASIIAKVTRDKMMESYHEQYPGYGFDKNSGYGTKEHLEGLKLQGITPIHRKTFAPIKEMI
ncbi:ribonuclease HII [Vagococcus fluvialis]|uniref:ribonuclease HII n=1 Tax=Vagococcus fluvialis TaxID=2738 RepID=UPI003B59D88D